MKPTSPALALAGLALLLATTLATAADPPAAPAPATGLFARDNLVAWCIVPFDIKKRSPEARAKMLHDLGFKRFAYDWRAEHVPTFDAELDALKSQGVALQSFWATGALNDETRNILAVLDRHHTKAELWVTLGLGEDAATGPEQERRVAAAVAELKPLAEAAHKVGAEVVLYNHMGWFGTPENQVAIIERLKGQGVDNVGVVFNLHHGHEYLPRLAEVLTTLKPYLKAVNLNGMDRGDLKGERKILPLGQGTADLDVLKTIVASGYRGPIGILGHTQDDAEARLRDNLDGLDWLVPQLDGRPAGPKPTPRTPMPPPLKTPPPAAAGGAPAPAAPAGPAPVATDANPAGDAAKVAALVADAEAAGDPTRGAEVFLDARFACSSCHKVGTHGGAIGPDLTALGRELPPAKIVESVLFPKREVKPGFSALALAMTDGRVLQGYKLGEADGTLAVRDVATGQELKLPKADIEEIREIGTLMPEGVADALTPAQRRDLFRFLIGLGRSPDAGLPAHLVEAQARAHAAAHAPTSFPHDRAPLNLAAWPHWQDPVNRDRDYDFYAKEAEYFRLHKPTPTLLPTYPGLDLGLLGHWGNQNENTWSDDRWNKVDVGRVLGGIFQGPAGVTVPKGVCVRLGDRGDLSACFNPQTLCYEALWAGGFVKFSNFRYGFLHGLLPDGTPLPRPEGTRPDKPFQYHGYYRHGDRVVFAYRLGDVEMLDAPWAEDGQFTRVVAPRRPAPPRPPDPRRPGPVASGDRHPPSRPAPRSPTPSTPSSRPSRTPGARSPSSATTTSPPTAPPTPAPCRGTSGGSRASTAPPPTGAASPPASATPSAWWSRMGRSMS